MSGATILVVDDDANVLRGVCGLLHDEGYRTLTAANTVEAQRLLRAESPAMMLLDVALPGETGLSFLARLGSPPPAPVVVLSGEASAGEAARAIQLGATDFVEKPPSPERLLTAVQNALRLSELTEERERLLQELARPGHLVGESPATEALRKLVARVGPSGATILITGETGTGKERVARALHLASGRKGRFVAVNCAAIPEALLESELFGAERGAFTGAQARRIGRIEQAAGGTLFFDEVGELPLPLQAKLLRVLETREVERLGGQAPVPVEVRVLAATHRDLQRAVAEGKFREDLYYRLHVLPIALPPLRERREDLLPLARAFLAELGAGPGHPPQLGPEAEAALFAHPWPGNVRELRNRIERACLLRDPADPLLRAHDLFGSGPSQPHAASPGEGPAALAGLGTRSYRELVEEAEREILREALRREGGNLAAAARLLQMDRGNLHRKARGLGLIDDGGAE